MRIRKVKLAFNGITSQKEAQYFETSFKFFKSRNIQLASRANQSLNKSDCVTKISLSPVRRCESNRRHVVTEQ
jgi:hypothetical protein